MVIGGWVSVSAKWSINWLGATVFPSDEAVDLALIAATVTAADTRVSRSTESQDSWTREIDLYVPVRDPALWAAAAVQIDKMLRFLTGDHWRLFVRARHRDYEQIVRRPAGIRQPPFDCVCLFSGGLDSFVGAIDLLAAHRNPLFVSHYWDASTSSQTYVRPSSRKHLRKPRPPARARTHWVSGRPRRGLRSRENAEGTFLPLLRASYTCRSGLRADSTIFVPENGLISLNVPL